MLGEAAVTACSSAAAKFLSQVEELKMDLEFHPDDFHSHQCPPLGDNPRTYARLAEFVNLRLREKLEKAPLVDGWFHDDGYILMDRAGDRIKDWHPENGIAVSARLVCITKLEGGEK